MLRLLLAKLNDKFNKPEKMDRAAIAAVGSSNEFNREQWIEEKLTALPQDLILLDAGAGEQPYKKYCQHLQYTSQDFAQYDPNVRKEGLQMGNWDYGKLDIVSDVTSIPRPDASFDVVLCTEVIEHIVNPIDAIKEFARLLKPGGQLLLTAPFCSMTHFAPYHFYSGYNRFFYEEVLSQSGFDIIEMVENGNYFEYIAQELKRIEEIGLKYAGVPQSEDVKHALNVLLDYSHKCSVKDQGSKELLFFGMHVKAIKKDAVPV